ncbi:MAG: BlaI/MecI/CopY family transcriptional regulator [Candidatus Hadarchaeales archaeon]
MFGWAEYRPKEEGLATVLSGLEAEIMKIMWREKRATARTVYSLLNSRHSVCRSKVNSTMNALCRKGLLSSTISKGKGGLRYIYRVKVSRKRFEREVVQTVVCSLLKSFRDSKRLVDEILKSSECESKNG